jgi:anthranilate synthase component 1
MLADIYTPVGIYLRLRDKYRDTILLESTDHQAAESSWSFICVNAIGGFEISSTQTAEYKFPGREPEKIQLNEKSSIADLLWNFMQHFELMQTKEAEAKFAQGLYGYTAYDAISFLKKFPQAMEII